MSDKIEDIIPENFLYFDTLYYETPLPIKKFNKLLDELDLTEEQKLVYLLKYCDSCNLRNIAYELGTFRRMCGYGGVEVNINKKRS